MKMAADANGNDLVAGICSQTTVLEQLLFQP